MKLVWIHDSNSNSIYDYLNALNLFCPKQRTNIVQTCMKMVQMDSLNFSDNFSYIIYLIWSYGWISMNFRSLYNFLEFSEFILNPENDLTASAWRQHDVSESTTRSRSNLTCVVHTSVTQELIPVKPSADWGLTRCRAHSQCHLGA